MNPGAGLTLCLQAEFELSALSSAEKSHHKKLNIPLKVYVLYLLGVYNSMSSSCIPLSQYLKIVRNPVSLKKLLPEVNHPVLIKYQGLRL